ncbi:MAG: SET domain-containing protein-lysine N-methyltransferase [Chitinophagaceae bacterium]
MMGRGVFTKNFIKGGTLIEQAPVIIMPPAHRKHLDKTLLHDYIFEWGKKRDHCAMALGYVPIYNHSYRSNCDYEMEFKNGIIRIKAVSDIDPGEELFINYNGEWNNETPVWFDAK